MNWNAEFDNDQQHREKQSEYIAGLHAEGCADAALGYSPRQTEDPYLDGYFKQLRERVIQGEKLEIRLKPSGENIPFAFGYDDNSHYASYEEF